LRRAGEGLCALLFAGVFLVFIYKIFMRYAEGNAVAWADEVSVVLFIWIVFLANALIVEDRRQIAFDLVWRHAGPKARRAIGIVRALLVGGLFLVALPGSWGYIAFLWRERTPVLLWRLDWVYACFGLFMLAVVLRLGWSLVRLLRPGWQGAVSE
jgi:TRAP-type C4-dicarboxylate transport system permease small subunit